MPSISNADDIWKAECQLAHESCKINLLKGSRTSNDPRREMIEGTLKLSRSTTVQVLYSAHTEEKTHSGTRDEIDSELG